MRFFQYFERAAHSLQEVSCSLVLSFCAEMVPQIGHQINDFRASDHGKLPWKLKYLHPEW